jgi:hypothetical protein
MSVGRRAFKKWVEEHEPFSELIINGFTHITSVRPRCTPPLLSTLFLGHCNQFLAEGFE